jgi:hypothetical protein
MKAEKILEYQKDKINLSQLEVIKEEGEPNRLNKSNLDYLSQGVDKEGQMQKSMISKNQSVKDLASVSKF